MEQLFINSGGGQSYGFILYQKVIGEVKKVMLPGKVRDRATVSQTNCLKLEYKSWLNFSNSCYILIPSVKMLCVIVCIYIYAHIGMGRWLNGNLLA